MSQSKHESTSTCFSQPREELIILLHRHPPRWRNVNRVIYPWTLTCKQSACILCEKGPLRQHRTTCCEVGGFSLCSLCILNKKSSRLACCLFCSCGYRNDTNMLEKCHVPKMHYIHRVLWTGLLTNYRDIFIFHPQVVTLCDCQCFSFHYWRLLQSFYAHSKMDSALYMEDKQLHREKYCFTFTKYWYEQRIHLLCYEKFHCSYLLHHEANSRCIRCVEDLPLQ